MAEPTKDEKPWWWPQPVNDEWRVGIRSEYPEETARMSDHVLDEYYAHGLTYADMWDHLGDARSEYQKLADAFLWLVKEAGLSPSDFFKSKK